MKRIHLLPFLALLVVFLFLYAWRCYQQPYFLPSNDLFTADLVATTPHLTGAKNGSRPGTVNQPPPSTDFLNLVYQQHLPTANFNPYPDYNSAKWRSQWYGTHHPCKGPRGVKVNGNRKDLLVARSTTSSAPNPNPMLGGYEESGVDETHCFDRFGRYGPYGLKDDGSDFNEDTVHWDKVSWGSLQHLCVEDNIELFGQHQNQTTVSQFQFPGNNTRGEARKPPLHSETSSSKQHLLRKAVLVRCRDSEAYDTETKLHLRALISELALHSGGEFNVFMLLEVQDSSRDIQKPEEYQKALKDFVPQEFRNITLLFNEALLQAWYPDISSEGGQTLHSHQATQLFSLLNTQFSHVWEMGLAVRYTGNWYNFLSNAMQWARRQPRRLQWERASKFYIPSYHGSYANFSDSIAKENPRGGVWGPVKDEAIRVPFGDEPPSITPNEDDFVWGVGEDADVIVPSVLVKTTGTPIFDYNTVQGFEDDSDRRALMVAPLKCLSRNLLHAMHVAQADGLDMRPELFPHTLALLHGMKVAALPVPTFHDNETSGADIDRLFNDPTREFFLDTNKWTLLTKAKTTFWWKLKFEQYPQQLYRKWFGVDQDGKQLDEARVGKLCLPGMLLHPIKDIVRS